MTATTNKHRDYRISIRLKAYYSEDLYEVVGTLNNISYSGALIVGTSMQPEIGMPCVLYLYLEPPGAFKKVSPFRLTGRVARHIPTGFAIEFEDKIDPDIRRLVDDVAAIMAASH